LASILNTRALWGKDLPSALVYLQSWNQINEHTVAVFPDRVVGTVSYKTVEEARAMAGNLAPALRAPRPQPNAPFVDWLSGASGASAKAFRADTFFSLDDDRYRVAQTANDLQLLAPALTVEQVKKLIGPPESVTVQLVQAESDRRPVDLTRYSYAGGKVV